MLETTVSANSDVTAKHLQTWDNKQQWEVKQISRKFSSQLGLSKKPSVIEAGWEPFGAINKYTYLRRPIQTVSVKKSGRTEKTFVDKQQWEVKPFSRKFSTIGISTKPIIIEAGWEPFGTMHKVTYLRRPAQLTANQKSNLSKNWDNNQRWEVKAVEKKFSAQLGLAKKPETIEAGWEPFGSTHKFTYIRRPI